MPIPKPKANETESDFVARCMGDDVMAREYPDQKQRAGVCYTQWKRKDMENEMETREIKDVEIFQVGTWKGTKYTSKDLDQIVDNFQNGVLEPYITIDHNPKATAQLADAVKALSLGFVSALRRVGDKLIADFKQVPKTIAELITKGALKKRSVELWEFYRTGGGEKYMNVLEAVTFHGANGVPALNTLSDVMRLYELQPQAEDCKKMSLQFMDEAEDLNVEKMTIEKAEYDELVICKNELTQLRATGETETMTKLKADNDALSQKLEAANVELKKFKDEVVKKELALHEQEADNFIAAKIQEGKVLPAYAEDYKADYVRYKIEDAERLVRFKKEIEERASMLPENFKDSKKKKGGPGYYKDTAELQVAIDEVMERDNVTWEVARKTVLGDLA